MTRTPRRRTRAFSMVELLIALTITATLFAATLGALDTSFKSYKLTTDSASTQVVARIVMQRLTAMIRTGEEFGPYPINPIAEPVITTNSIEFVSSRDPATNSWEVTTISRIAGDADTGPWVLVYQIATFTNGAFVEETDPIPLLDGLTELQFSLEYEVGPRLRRATIDMVIRPDDNDDNTVSVRMDAPHIRMVASATPRMYD
ncbi:MAG: PilW family protein [Phycisphaerales bacterium JB040]